MAVQAIKYARGRTQSTPLEHGEEGSGTQTFEEGSPLIINGQRIDGAATEPVDNIVGIALADASGTTDTDVMYVKALSGTVFEGNIGTSITVGDIAATDMNALYPLQQSGEDWFVDKTDNTAPCVRIIRFVDAVGTTNGRVQFEFLEDTLIHSN